jgi:DNA helicase-2/ATP-dependent DNA helicase PcrA
MTKNEIAEREIQDSIKRHIDDFNSFRFNAGAGAGKTYALIETLRYVSSTKIPMCETPQNVVCVTYTNVAVDEIKNRLGNSEIIHVSTIHELLWSLIKRAKPQLVQCHREKIVEVLEKAKRDLNTSEKSQFFSNLTEEQRKEFVDFSLDNKEIYYKYKSSSAAQFKKAYRNNDLNSPSFLNDCLRSVDKFKYVVRLIYSIKSLEVTLNKIIEGEEKEVFYDSKSNTDRLHYMKFSHDTLLEYGLKLIQSYPILCRMIIDQYPYFFVDEYQDTHQNVVLFLQSIHKYSIQMNRNWLIGYFGDTAQNIYDDGVGRKIVDLHPGLKTVDKVFNRRSHKQIIDVCNKIRADNIQQQPIFDSRKFGSVQFFTSVSECKVSAATQFLDEYYRDIVCDNRESDILDTQKSKINCLVLTNKLMASLTGFGDVYGVFSNSNIYFENLNTQVLSLEHKKLHPSVLSIYRFIKLYQDLNADNVTYFDIFGSSIKGSSFHVASSLIKKLKSFYGENFGDWVNHIASIFDDNNLKEQLCKVLHNRIDLQFREVESSDVFNNKVFSDLDFLMSDDFEQESSETSKRDSVLKLPLRSLFKWADFISGIESDQVSYHTYHGTKGEEYENVAIILEHSFGKNRNKFKNYFEVLQSFGREGNHSFSDVKAETIHLNTQNLLYVACSRAIKNLRILYLDDVSTIEDGITSIFGECKQWQIQSV